MTPDPDGVPLQASGSAGGAEPPRKRYRTIIRMVPVRTPPPVEEWRLTRQLTPPRTYTFATDFSGLDMASFAVKDAANGAKVVQRFACDNWHRARTFCRTNHEPAFFFDDVVHRPTTWPNLWGYFAGPPCQPWSSVGLRKGEGDDRSDLFDKAIDFVCVVLPAFCVIENSPLLLTYLQGTWLQARVARLTRAGYGVSTGLLNAEDHGLPQSRSRCYVVGIRNDARRSLPPLVQLQGDKLLSIQDVLAPPLASDDPTAEPKATWTTAVKNAREALEVARRDALDQDWVIAHQKGEGFTGPAGPTPKVYWPCLLHANTNGYWIGSRGRHATLSETSRAQGLTTEGVSWPRGPDAFRLLGNSFAKPVIERLVAQGLRHSGLEAARDRWEEGTAQARIRNDAKADRSHAPPVTLHDMWKKSPAAI